MTSIYMRSGTLADKGAILSIIQSAREFLAAQHINQWQGTYPDEAAVDKDLADGTNRLLIVDGEIAGTASLIEGPDPFYLPIEGEGWFGEADYMMIHRFALLGSFRGQRLARFFLSNLITEAYQRGYRDVRIDTHAENIVMQKTIQGSGFGYRGVVRLDEPVPERNAYQLLLDKGKMEGADALSE